MVTRRHFLKLAGGAAALASTSCGGGSTELGGPPQPPDPGPGSSVGALKNRIEHIIFTMQENRSFDHYLGRLPQFRRAHGIPGADSIDGLPADASNPSRDDMSKLVFPYHLSTECHENLSPSWNESHRQWNRLQPTSGVGTLDGFVYTAANFSRARAESGDPSYTDLDGLRAMGYYDERDIPFYYDLASKFAISDRYFCSLLAATLANRMYLLAASSFGRVFPQFPTPQNVKAPTIFDVLEDKGISWKIYLRSNGNFFSYYAWFEGYQRNLAKVVSTDQFLADAASGNLPQVAMIETGTDTGLDEHPLANIQRGTAFTRQLFTAVMKGPAWNKTIMLLTYDEGGGFYDHVPPPSAVPPDDIAPILRDTDHAGGFDRYGFRVPLIAVSPWVKKNHVSHQVADQTSILKLIERRFDLPALTRRDAAAHDLLDMFDFDRMSYEQPPALAEQPTNGPCNFKLVTEGAG